MVAKAKNSFSTASLSLFKAIFTDGKKPALFSQ